MAIIRDASEVTRAPKCSQRKPAGIPNEMPKFDMDPMISTENSKQKRAYMVTGKNDC